MNFLLSTVCVNWLYGKYCDIACPVNCKHGKDGICMFWCKYANMTGNHCDGKIDTITIDLTIKRYHN